MSRHSVAGRSRSATRFRRAVVAVVLLTVGAGLVDPRITPVSAAGAPPPPGGYFRLVPPGGALPTSEACAARVHRSGWEPRPENAVANTTTPPGVSLPGYTAFDGYDGGARTLADRVTGRFQGTTDEVLQWASCKWGIGDDVVRAMAVAESSWYQGLLDAAGMPVKGSGFGDYSWSPAKCQVGYTLPCPQSFGLLQVKATSEPGTFPWSRDSTAFNLDYALMVWRVCYEGWTSWLALSPGATSPYHGGDMWGCVGFWYSGDWYGEDGGASSYIQTVQGYASSKPWLRWADRSPSDPSSPVLSVNDTAAGAGLNQFEFTGNWYNYDEFGAYHGDVHANYSYNAYYVVRFEGTKIELYASVGPGGGSAAVSLDRGPEQAITFFGPTAATQRLLWSSPLLPWGWHIMKVRNTSPGLTNIADRVDITTGASSIG